VSVLSNFFPLQFAPRPIFWYRLSFDFSKASTDAESIEKTKNWKDVAQERSLLRMWPGRDNDDKRNAVVRLGHALLSTERFPEDAITLPVPVDVKSDRQWVIHQIGVTAALDTSITSIDQNTDVFVLNNVVDAIFASAYTDKLRDTFVDFGMVSKYPQHALTVARGISAKVCATTIESKRVTPVQLAAVSKVYSTKGCKAAVEDVLRRSPRNQRQALCEAFIGKKLLTTYGPKSRVYRILDVLPTECSPRTTFVVGPKESAKTTTYAEYFKTKYNLVLDDRQVFFRARPVGEKMKARAVNLPSQLCNLFEPDAEQRTKLPEICSIYPLDRHARYAEALNHINTQPKSKALMEALGVSISPQPLSLTGVVLPPVQIQIPTRSGVANVNTGIRENQTQMGFVKELGKLSHSGDVPRQRDVRVLMIGSRGLLGGRKRDIREVLATIEQIGGMKPRDVAEHDAPNNDIAGVILRAPAQVFEGNPASMMVIAHLDARETAMYREVKTILNAKGIASQVVAKNPSNQIHCKMIGQQMAAKDGGLNWFTDLAQTCWVKQGKSVMIVGCDVSAASSTQSGEGRSMKRNYCVVACTAFLVTNGKWYHYCNHYVEKGRSFTLFRNDAEAGASETASTRSTPDVTPGSASARHLPVFVQDALGYFKKEFRTTPDHLVVSQGGIPDGELAKCISEAVPMLDDVTTAALGAPRYSLVFALRRNNMRLSFEIKKAVPGSHMDQGALVNAPRGFVTEEGVPMVGDTAAPQTMPGFYLNAASCTLGHAKCVKFVVAKAASGIETPDTKLRGLERLFNALSYLFPNKADALPYPLPLKCADRYANQYAELIDLSAPGSETLHPALRPKMHYL
jgi:hypothetical protein